MDCEIYTAPSLLALFRRGIGETIRCKQRVPCDMEGKTVSTRVGSDVAEMLQTVVDAEDTTKADYLRDALMEQLTDDRDSMEPTEELEAEIEELKREVQKSQSAGNGNGEGLPDPLGLFE